MEDGGLRSSIFYPLFLDLLQSVFLCQRSEMPWPSIP